MQIGVNGRSDGRPKATMLIFGGGDTTEVRRVQKNLTYDSNCLEVTFKTFSVGKFIISYSMYYIL